MDYFCYNKNGIAILLYSLQRNCTIVSPYYYKMIPVMSSITIELQVNDDCPIRALEHVSMTL